MIRNPLLEKIKKARAKYIDIYVDNSFDLAGRIQYLMEINNIDQKSLAKKLNKNESEVSKWMAGSHNFTLKTLAKIEDVLGAKLFQVCNEQSNFPVMEVVVMYQDFYRNPNCLVDLDDNMTMYSTTKQTQIKAVLQN